VSGVSGSGGGGIDRGPRATSPVPAAWAEEYSAAFCGEEAGTAGRPGSAGGVAAESEDEALRQMARAGWQAARPLISSWLDTVCEEGAEAEGAEEGEASGASPLARYFAALVSERRLDQLGLAISFLARRVEAMPSGGQGAATLGKLVLPLADLVRD